jgi:hypothetical protein
MPTGRQVKANSYLGLLNFGNLKLVFADWSLYNNWVAEFLTKKRFANW